MDDLKEEEDIKGAVSEKNNVLSLLKRMDVIKKLIKGIIKLLFNYIPNHYVIEYCDV